MKIAAALGVWPFWGWKIINHGGWFTQVKGDRDKKKAFLTVSFMPAWTGYSSWLQNYIAPSVHTSLLQHFYIIYTSLLHHSFSSYVTFILCAICTSPLPERADSGFSGCAGNASRPRNKLRPRSPFSDGKNAGNRTSLAEWCEFPRYALARILMHAVKKEPARFWRVFGWFVACFTGFPSETPWELLRRCGQRMLW